ncbi:hypothetical protein C8R44DRAFT_27134 [Mycena epipterygia]|nr:hypothetical protein C8R44DRAFT_27134 [Mycena epipterygia]
MCGIHKLPVEVLAICVESLDVIDVLKLRSTCRDLYKSIEQFRSIWVDLHRRFSTLEHGSAPLHDLHAASLSEMRRCTIQSHRLDARWTSGRISLPPEATPFPVHPTTKRVVFLPGTDWIFCIGESGSVFLNSLSAPFAEPTGKQVVFSESKMLLHTSTLSWSDDLGSYILLVALARSDLVSRIHEGEIRIYLVEPISAKLVLVAAQLLDGRIFSVTFQKDLLCVTCWRRLEPIPFRVYIRRLVFQGDPATSLNTGTTVTVNKIPYQHRRNSLYSHMHPGGHPHHRQSPNRARCVSPPPVPISRLLQRRRWCC